MRKKLWKRQGGFTLIELMIVISIIGILASIAVPSYKLGVIKAREAVLRETLWSFTSTIDQFYADQGKYPDTLDELVAKGYLRDIPKDPMTGAKDWVPVPPPPPPDGTAPQGMVYEVHSNSSKISPVSGTPYNEWK